MNLLLLIIKPGASYFFQACYLYFGKLSVKFDDVLEQSFICGENIKTLYNSDTSFCSVIKMLINFDN